MHENFLVINPDGHIQPNSILWPERTAESQYEMLLVSDRIDFSPFVFINRDTILSLGGFDERFRLLEDYPLYLNLTKNGYELYFMYMVTVNYLQYRRGINNTGRTFIINLN